MDIDQLGGGERVKGMCGGSGIFWRIAEQFMILYLIRKRARHEGREHAPTPPPPMSQKGTP